MVSHVTFFTSETSQNHRMLGVGRDLFGSSRPTPHRHYPSDFQFHPAYLTDMSTSFLPAAQQNQHTSERDSFQLHASPALLWVRLLLRRGWSLGCERGQEPPSPVLSVAEWSLQNGLFENDVWLVNGTCLVQKAQKGTSTQPRNAIFAVQFRNLWFICFVSKSWQCTWEIVGISKFPRLWRGIKCIWSPSSL